MVKLKIALLDKNLKEQLIKGLHACQTACQQGADIALFPEMWSSSYQIPQNKSELAQLAISSDSTFIQTFAKEAQKLDMAITISFLEKRDPALQDSMILFDRHGRKVLHYAKVHTCNFGDERMLMHDKNFCITNLDTKIVSIKVGSMICFDREFSENARTIMLEGAELILVPKCLSNEKQSLV